MSNPNDSEGQRGQPLYAWVFQTLRGEILAGRFEKTMTLPSESALERQFSVSKITIRRAVEKLAMVGLVERSRGRMTRITPPAGQSILADVASEVERALTDDTDPRVLSFAWIAADPDLAETLEVAIGSRVLWITRLRSRQGKPVAHTSAYLPESVGMSVNEADVGNTSLIRLLKRSGYVAASADQVLSAAPCPRAIAPLLDLAPGNPIFCMRRLMRDADGRPMQLLKASHRWDAFSYRVSMVQDIWHAAPQFVREDAGVDDIFSRI